MKKRIALALLGALLVMASVPTVAYAQEESTESTENTDTLTPDKKPATTITKQINEDVYQVLDFDDTQEEEFAKKGFITAPDSLQITDDDGNVVWNMDNYDFVRDADSPDSANPSLWRNTKSNANYGLFQVSDDIYQVRGYDLSNMTFVRTDNGWIIMDCLASSDTAKAALELFKSEMGDIHIVAVIISHAHIDHYGGIQGVLTQDELADPSLSLDEQIASGKTAIIVPDGFENAVMSENVFVGTAMKRRSLYQYGSVIQPGEQGRLSVGIGLAVSQGEVGYLSPTFNVTEEVFETTIDGVKVIFQLTPDTESPAEMNTYFPDKKALWLAENCTASMHNIYTLRGAEVRDANSWARYITEAQSLFGKDAEVVFQSHNWPHWGNNVIQEYMTNTAAVYKFMHDQTLLYINQGYTSTEIANMIELPEALNKVWYTRQYYGTLKHNVKAIYQKYMGWYDANPVHLDELEPTEYAKKLVEYLGDADKVLEMAKSDYEKGEYQWVAQITNTLVYADPENEQAKYLCADALEQLGYQAESGAWRNAYLVAASELRNGTDMYPPSAVTGSGSTAQQMDMQTTLDYMGIMLDSTKLADKSFTINLQVTNDQNYLLKVHHGVLLYYPDEQDENADITITTKKAGILAIAACNEDGISKLIESVEGDQELYKAFCESMTPLSLYFNIIEP
ncbi:MBL fold metallo-hydrolase [Ruminococcus sp. AF37-6AT]|jgi:alkyl sulfatase BDS1-like metallo-beta-lactamase superfamily hydrolase|uniref:alkyl/aryl-sulfatase n=1 Tax=Blautia sp. HCN-1074 TaxID=3134667 RepID=UPI000E4332F1|nr:MBL fold metallo-hydrolase [Ruminococcus sp. TM10-9AT]RGW23282.1 MBL fold metallo-hydrolase [Ruminococcus sp. AF13-37]RGW24760.1 MBL fold metallo-hydrolase [Ruminococcus sp. AF13-28]RGY86620.1 MBL fold metallo-hydrolase [Ruminococcus sp. AM58-7XD]RHD97085.1 MBL fold metallo-hydrolase [Ruminococcus sp. AM30-15AC]RHJ88958.1 MBL fold metallo-hydrolase [Ruminococcus sp. AM07-21]RHL42230.1 MBL fold metallo-hydrolase [Ruminococcus sp. AF37-6AT]RHP51571.1 MBL fold metallo-hydrolase [Ruminococcus